MIMCFFNAYIKIKILIISGSPRPRENTKITLDEMVKIFDQVDIECAIEQARLGHCVFDDCVNAIDDQKFEEADGLVVGTPDYYGSANATLVAFLYNTSFDKNDEGWNFMAIFGKKLSLDSFFCITDSYSEMIYWYCTFVSLKSTIKM